MKNFSKSKLLALRQCPKRLWLEVHKPELRADSAQTQQSFRAGHEVGDIARALYDPQGHGSLIDVQAKGISAALAHSAQLLDQARPVFEAGFSGGGALAFADVMLPQTSNGGLAWRMVEVKSSTSIKDYHRDDVAVQAYAAQEAGVRVTSIAVAHIDSSWVYPGAGNYQGLLKENDVTEEAQSRRAEVQAWIQQARQVTDEVSAPVVPIGAQCDSPYACGFYAHCSRGVKSAEYPLNWLPRFSAARIQELADQGIDDMRGVPDAALNDRQRRVKQHTLTGSAYFDAQGAAADLAPHALPVQFLDFETIQFAVPIWPGTRPYQMIPFQFSWHQVDEQGHTQHAEFLDLSGLDPSASFVNALIAACGQGKAPIFVYNQGFEMARIRELAERFPAHGPALASINARIVDLLPIARERYYHPSQKGSWSIKVVLPAVVPELKYSDLDGVQDGGLAMDAFLEAIHPLTLVERREQIRQQLLAYCKLDTYAMVRLWQVFSGATELNL